MNHEQERAKHVCVQHADLEDFFSSFIIAAALRSFSCLIVIVAI
jgi:hypothetical protein